jgi:hypothetical protein
MTESSRRCRRRALHLAKLVVVAMAVEAPGQARADALRIDGEIGYETGIFGAPSYTMLGAGAAATVMPGLELAAGARLGAGGTLPALAVAGFARASLLATLGRYRPAFGIELEATSATDAEPAADDPPGSMKRQLTSENRHNFLRVSAVACPARWQWQHAFVGVGSFRVGTPLSAQIGDRIYLAVWFATVGYTR